MFGNNMALGVMFEGCVTNPELVYFIPCAISLLRGLITDRNIMGGVRFDYCVIYNSILCINNRMSISRVDVRVRLRGGDIIILREWVCVTMELGR